MNRRRNWGVLLGGLLFAGFVVIMATQSVVKGYSLGGVGSALAVGGLIIGGAAALVLGGIAIARQTQSDSYRLVAELTARLPNSPVFRVYGEADFGIALRRLSGRSQGRIPHFAALAVGQDAIEFYARPIDEPIVRISAKHVASARTDKTLTSNAIHRPVVTLVVDTPGIGRVIVPIVVMRESRGSVLPAGTGRANQLVAAVGAMRSNNIDVAIEVFTGKGEFNFPHRSVERVREHFPGPEGVELARRVEALEAEFYEVKPHPGETLVAASDRAASIFAGHHPEVGSDAIAALRWCFAFDWK